MLSIRVIPAYVIKGFIDHLAINILTIGDMSKIFKVIIVLSKLQVDLDRRLFCRIHALRVDVVVSIVLNLMIRSERVPKLEVLDCHALDS